MEQTLTQRIITGLRIIALCIVGGLLTALFNEPTGTLLMLRDLLALHDWLPAKGIAGFTLAYHWKPVTSVLRNSALWFWDLTCDTVYFVAGETKRPSDCIDGIPRHELLDFLFTEKSFKQDDVMAAFRIPRYKVTELKQNLERVGVLVRGPNNSHVLNSDISRRDVASILNARTASELQPLFRKRDDGSFTSDPSRPEIEERVASLLSAEEAGFRTVPISA